MCGFSIDQMSFQVILWFVAQRRVWFRPKEAVHDHKWKYCGTEQTWKTGKFHIVFVTRALRSDFQ